MKSKANGRSGLIIAAGLCACLWGPLQLVPAAAAPAASQDNATQQSTSAVANKKKAARPSTRQVKKKKAAPAKAAKPTAEKTPAENERDSAAASTEPTPDGAAQSGVAAGLATPSAALPPSVANANAQVLPVAGAASGAPAPQPATAASDGSADAQVVPPDEVNELDRAAADTPPAVMAATVPAPSPTAANSDQATVGAAQMSSATSNDGAWDKASVIGKIFIAVGGLLTLASAARMFMA